MGDRIRLFEDVLLGFRPTPESVEGVEDGLLEFAEEMGSHVRASRRHTKRFYVNAVELTWIREEIRNRRAQRLPLFQEDVKLVEVICLTDLPHKHLSGYVVSR